MPRIICAPKAATNQGATAVSRLPVAITVKLSPTTVNTAACVRPTRPTSGKPSNRPNDPAANSRPTATGPAPNVTVARNGRMRSSGAEKNTTAQKLTARARTVGVFHTYDRPARASARKVATVGSAASAGRPSTSGTAARNVAASTSNTGRAPHAANNRPATGGPTTAPNSRVAPRNALAWGRSSSATTSAMHRPVDAPTGVSSAASRKTNTSSTPSEG